MGFYRDRRPVHTLRSETRLAGYAEAQKAAKAEARAKNVVRQAEVCNERIRRKKKIRRFGAMFGSEYCVPDGLGFRLDSERVDFEEYILSVKDDKGEGKMNWEIKMYDPLSYKSSKYTVHDNHGKIFMTLQESPSEHRWGIGIIRPRWKVYKGDSTNDKDFLFTVKQPWVFWKGDLEVYLPSTKEEAGAFDFEVVRNWLNKDCVVKNKNGDILAEGYEGRGWFEDYSYTTCVRPGVDYAFILALTVIFYQLSTGGAIARLCDPDDVDSD